MITFLFWATSNISLHQLILPKKHLYGSLYLLFLHKSILSEKFNDKWLIRNMSIRGWFDDPNELYVNIDAFSSSNQVMMYRCYFVNEVWALLNSTWQDQWENWCTFSYIKGLGLLIMRIFEWLWCQWQLYFWEQLYAYWYFSLF